MHHTFLIDAVNVCDALFAHAYTLEASDIHLQPQQHHVAVRLRVNGVLTSYDILDHDTCRAAISRLKVLASCDITQVHAPQDGALQVVHKGRACDVRVSFFPSLYGEKVVLRLLDQGRMVQDLSRLGFNECLLSSLASIVAQEQGFFLVTGPTGAGKTTTLYALLCVIDASTRNIVTLEDPIEYRIDAITQTQVNPPAGLTFATAIRSLLRQDPDVALIGELRDQETAQSAIEAALTGHLVLSSLHTSNAASAPIRLREMGIEPYVLASSLSGVLAQRLARVLCGDCKKKQVVTGEQRAWLRARSVKIKSAWQASGCATCHDTGVQGRTVIAELFILDAQARQAVMAQTTVQEMQAHAVRAGMVPMIVQGAALVSDGVIALEELMRLGL